MIGCDHCKKPVDVLYGNSYWMADLCTYFLVLKYPTLLVFVTYEGSSLHSVKIFYWLY